MTGTLKTTGMCNAAKFLSSFELTFFKKSK